MATILQKLNPIPYIKRALTYTLGPAKDWPSFKNMMWNASRAKVAVTTQTVLGIPAYWRAVDILATQIASLPFSVYQVDADGNIKEARTHPLWKLLNFRPHPYYDTFTFRETIMRQLLVGGELGKPGNCLILINRDARGAVLSLELVENNWEKFTVDNVYFYKVNGYPKAFHANDIIHLHAYSHNGVYGNSPLSFHQDTLGRAISELGYAASYYGNGAHLSGVLETDKPLNKEQAGEILDNFTRRYGGQENMGGIGLLAHGLKFTHTGQKLDATDIEARRITSEDVANITGVPVDLLNSGDKTSTFASAEQRNKQFVTYTLRTWCKRIESELNSKLFSFREQGKTFVRFNLDGLLQADTKARGEYYQTMYNIRAINPNEIRALENMNPYEGGDEYGQPLASNSTENTGTPQTEENEEEAIDIQE